MNHEWRKIYIEIDIEIYSKLRLSICKPRRLQGYEYIHGKSSVILDKVLDE